MPKNVYSCDGNTLLRVEDAAPTHNDRCERCGECLLCGGEMCTNGGDHWWVVYECEEIAQTESEIADDNT